MFDRHEILEDINDTLHQEFVNYYRNISNSSSTSRTYRDNESDHEDSSEDNRIDRDESIENKSRVSNFIFEEDSLSDYQVTYVSDLAHSAAAKEVLLNLVSFTIEGTENIVDDKYGIRMDMNGRHGMITTIIVRLKQI